MKHYIGLIGSIGLICSLSLAANADTATQLISVVQSKAGIPSTVIKNLDVDGQLFSYSGVDPNFKDSAAATYAGRSVTSLINSSRPSDSVTVVAKDQYIFTANAKFMSENKAAIITTANGKSISLAVGGPNKLAFPARTVQEEFVWYVKGIVVGDFNSFTLQIEVNNKPRSFSTAALKALPGAKIISLPSPRGARPEDPANLAVTAATAVPLGALLKDFNLATLKSVTLVDLVGNSRTLDSREAVNKYLISCTDHRQFLSVSHGGPCMAIPQDVKSGEQPFFFLKTIKIN